jgi:hypothetical protein
MIIGVLAIRLFYHLFLSPCYIWGIVLCVLQDLAFLLTVLCDRYCYNKPGVERQDTPPACSHRQVSLCQWQSASLTSRDATNVVLTTLVWGIVFWKAMGLSCPGNCSRELKIFPSSDRNFLYALKSHRKGSHFPMTSVCGCAILFVFQKRLVVFTF